MLMSESVRMVDGRLLGERPWRSDDRDAPRGADGRPARSRTVNLAESPLGWLHARGHVSRRSSMPASGCGSTGSAPSSTRR
jgi:hypothetical protein